MNARTGRRLATALLGAGVTLLAAAPATAAPPSPTQDASVSVGRLVLEPTDRGYHGTLQVTVTNKGSAENYMVVLITEPVAGSFAGLQPSNICWYGDMVESRRVVSCGVPGPDLAPGERRTFTVAFHVLTTPQAYPMVATGGLVEVMLGNTNRVADSTDFNTLFRSTSGALGNPRPYLQDTQADASITSGNATLTRQADGTFAGRMSVTVRYGGDAAHDYLWVEATLPAGARIDGTDPQHEPSFFDWFNVPGGKFMPGEERTFDVLLWAPAETLPGDLGTATLQLNTRYRFDDIADANPADNTAAFSLTALDG